MSEARFTPGDWEIEISDAIKAEVVKQISDRLLVEVRKMISPEKIAKDIREQVRGELISKIAGDFHKKLNTSDLVNTSIRDAEERINRRIEKTIRQGVVLRISLGQGDSDE